MLDYDRRVSANLVQFLQSMPTTLLESIGKSFNQSNTEFLILYQNPHTLNKLGFAVELIHKLVTTMEVSQCSRMCYIYRRSSGNSPSTNIHQNFVSAITSCRKDVSDFKKDVLKEIEEYEKKYNHQRKHESPVRYGFDECPQASRRRRRIDDDDDVNNGSGDSSSSRFSDCGSTNGNVSNDGKSKGRGGGKKSKQERREHTKQLLADSQRRRDESRSSNIIDVDGNSSNHFDDRGGGGGGGGGGCVEDDVADHDPVGISVRKGNGMELRIPCCQYCENGIPHNKWRVLNKVERQCGGYNHVMHIHIWCAKLALSDDEFKLLLGWLKSSRNTEIKDKQSAWIQSMHQGMGKGAETGATRRSSHEWFKMQQGGVKE